MARLGIEMILLEKEEAKDKKDTRNDYFEKLK
jgi:hypothetical protein